MTAAVAEPIATAPICNRTLRYLLPRIIRTFQEFAEAEIILPNGPKEGLHYATEFMPWQRAVLSEFDAERYRRFFGSGPVQSGKTLLFFILPILYHLFEVGENVIVGVPVIELAQAIFEERLRPVIQRTRYARLMPRAGVGSRGGRFNAVRFTNGAWLRFMGAGGGDEQRSSHTARVVVLTEVDKMDKPGETSREADPVTQIEARTAAYGERGRVYAECTMSTSEGRIYQEVTQFGSDTRIWVPCPHCGTYVVPARESFIGWQDAPDVITARKSGAYVCTACGAVWSEKDRATAIRQPVLGSREQTVSKDGNVKGDLPATDTFGVRWTQMLSPLVSMAEIAQTEYRADRSGNPADMRAVMQFVWAEPFDQDLTDLSGLTRDIVLEHVGRHVRGVVPPDCTKVSVFIDLGLYECWWSAWAWTPEAVGYCIDYGAIEVPQDRKANPLAILAALRQFRADVLEPGWVQNETPRRFDLCMVDAHWEKDVAWQFISESGAGYAGAQGQGSGRNQPGWRSPKPGKGRRIGNEWAIVRQPDGRNLVLMNGDHWKREVHNGFRAPIGEPGSLQLYKAVPMEHRHFANQITAERETELYKPGVGLTRVWESVRRANHWLDTAYGARCAADMLGIRLMVNKRPAATAGRTMPGAQRVRRGGIRTRY